MKKLFYLIPIILLALNFVHLQLHNDAVTFSPSGALTDLKPSHWKMRDYTLNASVSLSQSSTSNSSSTVDEAYTQGAKFYGFPFGFYFANDLKNSVSDLQVSAYSWLWALVDGLIVLFGLLLAVWFNRRGNGGAAADIPGFISSDSPQPIQPGAPQPPAPPAQA